MVGVESVLMADPDVRHSESTTDTSDNDDRAQNSGNVTMEFAHQNEPCSTTNEAPNAPAFPQDFSVFIQEHEESQLDAMFSSRFTVVR
ncbi:unnamed protein product [Anisakis simplex]|uniref:CACTA en-spm transposon protein n=1 Tax=Anisakis simplex TaxID=6269 RepID=A0A0M3JF83_ANISI|nr:unnamed protein product [Anisakis simplex]